MAQNRKDNPTLATHVAEASGAEREIESSLAAHLLLITRAHHHARLERHLEASKNRVARLELRLKELGGSARSVARPSSPAKGVKGAAKASERRATKLATGGAKKVRDAAELRRVLEAAREEQQEALKQSAAYISLRALAKASKDKETAKLAKGLRDEHREWASFLSDELKTLSKKLVKAEKQERETAASTRRSSAAKEGARSRSASRRKPSASSSNGRKATPTGTRKASSGTRKASSGTTKPASGTGKTSSGARRASSSARKTSSGARRASSGTTKAASGARKTSSGARKTSSGARKTSSGARRASGGAARKARSAKS